MNYGEMIDYCAERYDDPRAALQALALMVAGNPVVANEHHHTGKRTHLAALFKAMTARHSPALVTVGGGESSHAGPVKVCIGRMQAAVAELDPESFRDAGFINRTTGEVIFVWADDREAGMPQCDNDRGVMNIWRRLTMESQPSVWVEIPRKNQFTRGDAAVEAFINNFFEQNGIVAELA